MGNLCAGRLQLSIALHWSRSVRGIAIPPPLEA
jgi:hypothetical protein